MAKTNYENWVPRKMLLFLLALFALSVMVTWWGNYSSSNWLFVTGAVLSIVFLILVLIIYWARQKLAFVPGSTAWDIIHLVADKLDWHGNGTLLDIGCGSGALTLTCAHRFPQAHIIGLDYWAGPWEYSQNLCERNARAENLNNAKFMHGDASALPFADGMLDAAVSNFVFHEVRSVDDKKLLIQEALRVLKPGAPFVFHDIFLNEKLYGSKAELKQFLKSLDLTELYFTRTDDMDFNPRFLQIGFIKNTALIYGKK